MKKKKRWELDRRTFLRCSLGGAATLMGLPLLEEMMGSVARADANGYKDANFIALFKPLGSSREHFYPSQYKNNQLGMFTGSQWALSETLAPMAPHKAFLNAYAGIGYPIRGGDHNEEAGRFMTGLSQAAENDALGNLDTAGIPGQTGKSVDQYIADHLFNAANPLRAAKHSLQLTSDFAPSWQEFSMISYKDKDSPLIPQYDAQKAFDSLFFGFNPGEATNALTERQIRKRNILDEIWNSSTKSLIAGLSSASRQSVDQYLTSIDAVKKKIDSMGSNTTPVAQTCTKPARPGTFQGTGTEAIANIDYKKHVEIMMDLMVLALQCNQYRVASYMFGPAGGGYRRWSDLITIPSHFPTPDLVRHCLNLGWHTGSHYDQISHPNYAMTDSTLKTASHLAASLIDRYHVDRLAYLTRKLKEANLLDRTLVLFGGSLGDSDSHWPYAVPCLTVGNGAGAKTDRLYVFQRYFKYDSWQASIAKLHVGIMNAFGVTSVNMNNFGIRKGEDANAAPRKITLNPFV